MQTRTYVKATIIFLLVYAIYFGIKQKKSSIEEEWRSATIAETVTIGRILSLNNVTACGEYQVKGGDGEYLIACNANGNQWEYFEVLEYSQAVFKYTEFIEPPY